MPRTSLTRAALAASAAVTFAACATTTPFHSTWRNPAAETLSLTGRKVAVLVLHDDEALRHAAEDTLARGITAHGGDGVPAHTLLPRETVRERDEVKALLEQAQVDDVVAVRAVGWERAISPNHGTYWGSPHYASFWGPGFWGSEEGGDGHRRTDKVLVVETLVYSLAQSKLVWAWQSQTMSPSEVGPFIRELSTRAGAELAKQGLLADPSRVWAAGF